MRSPRASLALLLLALAACGGGAGAAHDPRPTRLEPDWGLTGAPVPVVIHGENFVRLATQNVERAPAGETLDTYQAFLGETPLEGVRWVDAGRLEARVPQGLALGWHALRLVSPLGREVRLERAYYASDTPAARLAARASATPEATEVGVEARLALTVENTGGTAALGVTPAFAPAAGSPAAQLTLLTPPQDLAPGESAVFHWGVVGTGAGVLAGRFALAAREAGSERALAVADAASARLTLLAPPALRASALLTSGQTTVGQTVRLLLTVHNDGQVAARAVTPRLEPFDLALAQVQSGPEPADVAAGASRTFEWQLLAAAPGTLRLTATAAGTDALTGAPVGASAPAVTLGMQTPGALQATLAAPAQVTVGQQLPLTLTVRNTGQSTARAVAPGEPRLFDSATAVVGPAPQPQDIPGGTGRAFTWWLTTTGAGRLTVSMDAAGTDAVSGLPLSAAAASVGPVAVQSAAALAATLQAPTLVGTSAPFTITLTVTNTGQTTAQAVTPDALVTSDAAALALVDGPAPASATLAGGASAAFTWHARASEGRSFTLQAGASGQDAALGTAVRASAASVPVRAGDAEHLVSDPTGDGATFAFVFGYGGRVYVGPGRQGAGGARFLPDGSGAESFGFAFRHDVTGNVTSNKAFDYDKALDYTSLGFTGCVKDTPACGPDNESGRGLFFSGLWGGTEWLGAAGGRPGGEFEYLYFSRDTDATLDFLYMDLSQGMGANTRAPSAAHFHGGQLYVGYTDGGGSRPYLTVHRAPPAAPGLDATSPTDYLDLEGVKLPAVGNSGTPKNPASMIGIDALATFNGKLYVANNGGCARSTSTTPGPANVSGNWVDCTPSTWAARSSVVLGSSGVDLTPAQKAVPAMVAFGGRLFLARNTTAGPQLFACTPNAAGDCNPADWTLVAPNTAAGLATDLTQLEVAGRTRITLLAATARHLYVGFDLPAGLDVYRTEKSAPTAGDFLGRSGCAASAGLACEGLGGRGLGTGARTTFSAQVLPFDGQDYVYLSAGDGSGPVSVHRLVD